jgi:hypothetical protein
MKQCWFSIFKPSLILTSLSGQPSLPAKSDSQVCRPSLPAKSASQVCRPSLPAKSAGQVCWPSLPAKSAGQSAGQVCRPSLPAKSAGQVCKPSRLRMRRVAPTILPCSGRYSVQRVHTLCQKCCQPQPFNALLGLPRL